MRELFFVFSSLYFTSYKFKCESAADPSGIIGDNGFRGEMDLSGCGDMMCNPDFGENAETCPKDCKENDNKDVNQNQPLDRRVSPVLLLILPTGILFILATIAIIFWKKGIWKKLWLKILVLLGRRD